MIEESQPFSEERREITRLGYEAVDKLFSARQIMLGKKDFAYGAQDRFTDILKQLIEALYRERPEQKIRRKLMNHFSDISIARKF